MEALGYNNLALYIMFVIFLMPVCFIIACFWRFVWPKRGVRLGYIVWPLWLFSYLLGKAFFYLGVPGGILLGIGFPIFVAWGIITIFKDSKFANPHGSSNKSNSVTKDKSFNLLFLGDLAYVMGYSVKNGIPDQVQVEAKKLFGILAYSPWYMKKTALSKEIEKIAKCSRSDTLGFINSLVDMMNKADAQNTPRTHAEIFQFYNSVFETDESFLTDVISAKHEDLVLQASNGDPVAQHALGCCYFGGDGVPQNYNEAVKWFMLSAKQGNASAQCDLGHCYYEGKGVPQNYSEAANWFMQSSAQNNSTAWYNLGHCYYEGKGVPQNYEQAFMWFLRAAAYGDISAQLCVGDMYLAGHGVERDVEQANSWYQKAASQN